MKTIKQQLKEVNEMLSKTYQTTIIWEVRCNPERDVDSIMEIFKTEEEAKGCCSNMLKEEKIKFWYSPILVDDDTFEEVTQSNYHLYDNDGTFVKQLIESIYN